MVLLLYYNIPMLCSSLFPASRIQVKKKKPKNVLRVFLDKYKCIYIYTYKLHLSYIPENTPVDHYARLTH